MRFALRARCAMGQGRVHPWRVTDREGQRAQGQERKAQGGMTMSPSSKSTCADRTARCSSSSGEVPPLILKGRGKRRWPFGFLFMNCLQKSKGHSLKPGEINVHVHVDT